MKSLQERLIVEVVYKLEDEDEDEEEVVLYLILQVKADDTISYPSLIMTKF